MKKLKLTLPVFNPTTSQDLLENIKIMAILSQYLNHPTLLVKATNISSILKSLFATIYFFISTLDDIRNQ